MHLISWEVLCRPKERGGLGLRRSALMNKSLLVKLAWRLFHEEDATWSRIIRAKYGISLDEPPMFAHKTRASVVWRGLEWCADLFLLGLRWNARNGKRILFWSDHWLGDGRIRSDCSHELLLHEKTMLVRDYWQEDRGWKWDCLNPLLSASNLLLLANVRLDRGTDVRDEMHWLSDRADFSVTLAYELGLGTSQTGQWHGWRRIWSLHIQQRIRVFLWMMAHERILTNSVRWRRGLAANSDCWRCGGGCEDVLHVIRDCPQSRRVWDCFQQSYRLNGFFTLDLREWILNNLQAHRWSQWGAPWPEVMAMVCWSLWKWRNHSIFQREEIPLQCKIYSLRQQVQESVLAWRSSVSTTSNLFGSRVVATMM